MKTNVVLTFSEYNRARGKKGDMRKLILAVTMNVIAALAPTLARASHDPFVRLVCYGPAPVRAVATIDIDGSPLQISCNEAQRVSEVAVAPRSPSWVLHLEMVTPLGIRTVMRQGNEWPLRFSTELDDRECQLDLR